MSRRRAGRMSVYAALAVILAAALFPLWWMIVTSLKPPVDIFAGVALWPQKLTGSNYDVLFEQHHFRSFLVNSIAIVAVAVLESLVLGTLAAYSLTRFRLRLGLNQSALVVALLIRMIPGILLVIPLYIVLSKNGLLDTRLGLILVYSGLNTSFAIWWRRGPAPPAEARCGGARSAGSRRPRAPPPRCRAGSLGGSSASSR